MTEGINDTTTYDWIVSTQRDLRKGNVFFFWIKSDVDISNHFASHYFNITDDDGTTATSSPSSSASPTSISSLSSSTATSTAESSANSSSETGGLQPQAKVGIGVGVGLGGAFIIVIAGIIWYFRRRAQKSSDGGGGSSDVVPPTGAPMTANQSSSNGIYELPAKAPSWTRYPAEVSAENERYEMPS